MLSVCHLYPELTNGYGNGGNITAFIKRCQWRSISTNLINTKVGQKIDFTAMDFLLIGHGGEQERKLMLAELQSQKDILLQAIEQGLVVLAIGSGYQILGHSYPALGGEIAPGLGLLDFTTKAGESRLTGDIVVELTWAENKMRITGFENHAGRTYLGQVEPLGKVLAGNGNNGQDGQEGAKYKNVFCSYLHGPLLPKNSALTDHLIKLALNRRGIQTRLVPLDDSLEEQANQVILRRLLNL